MFSCSLDKIMVWCVVGHLALELILTRDHEDC